MVLKISYNDNSEIFVNNIKKIIDRYPFIRLETYHEQLFKERKKALKLKYEWGTQLSPFAILIDDNNKAIKAFYSEQDNCNFDKILEILNSIIIY